MAWTTGADTRCLPHSDVDDGRLTGYIQAPGPLPDFALSYCWTRDNYDAYIVGNGDLGTNTLPTRAAIEAWRLWDPVSEIPGSFAAEGGGTTFVGIRYSWAEDPDFPTVDNGWATGQQEIEIEIYSDSGLTNLVDEISPNYGGSPTVWTSPNATVGAWYYARARYRNKTNTTMVGSWTPTVSAKYGEGPTVA